MSNSSFQNPTYIIYLTGKPGIGKYTIAQALAKEGFVVCDNQLINNPIFSLLNYDGLSSIPAFAWEAIAQLRTVIFDFIANLPQGSFVLTNNLYEDEGDRNLYTQVKQIAEKRGSLFVPVRLEISKEEHFERLTQPSRRDHWKTINPEEVHNPVPLLSLTHPNLLTLDVTSLSAQQAADQILAHARTCS